MLLRLKMLQDPRLTLKVNLSYEFSSKLHNNNKFPNSNKQLSINYVCYSHYHSYIIVFWEYTIILIVLP